jgi:hypothetical protein
MAYPVISVITEITDGWLEVKKKSELIVKSSNRQVVKSSSSRGFGLGWGVACGGGRRYHCPSILPFLREVLVYVASACTAYCWAVESFRVSADVG